MTASLTPSLALAYLRELSTDIRASVVLDATGERLAGDEQLVAPARRLLGGATASTIHEAAAHGGTLLVARATDGRSIAALAGDRALLPLLRHDLERTLAALAARTADRS